MDKQQTSFLQKLLRLRYCVLALGEQQRWWPSSLLSEDSFAILEYALPQTRYAAAVIAATEVGRNRHDELIGAGKLHLFRLPQSMEEQVFQYLHADENAAAIAKGIEGRAIQALEELSEYIAVNEQEGPVLVGGLSEVHNQQILAAFAKHYLEAFRRAYQTFPYLA